MATSRTGEERIILLKSPEQEKKMRKELVKKALRALATPIDQQTVFLDQ